MLNKILKILFIFNTLFILMIIKTYDNVLRVYHIYFLLFVLWIILHISMNKEYGLWKSKEILPYGLIIIFLLNLYLAVHLPKFSYNKAVNLITETEFNDSNVVIKNNKPAKSIYIETLKYKSIKYDVYIIIAELDTNNIYYWFNPYSGYYNSFDANELDT